MSGLNPKTIEAMAYLEVYAGENEFLVDLKTKMHNVWLWTPTEKQTEAILRIKWNLPWEPKPPRKKNPQNPAKAPKRKYPCYSCKKRVQQRRRMNGFALCLDCYAKAGGIKEDLPQPKPQNVTQPKRRPKMSPKAQRAMAQGFLKNYRGDNRFILSLQSQRRPLSDLQVEWVMQYLGR